ncbi:hypothetical protein OsI_28723 [Oryza sativa Indica Group]|uniref:No apical meristem-associated C-terminal domain-containing protein n=1 Tax=Oryza sativa subsp. indica TaxID=39946 RepID=B8B9J1_ORYSI|nr:hypothetical protein OsI_28723 [Oryza sativa Indica Group]
MVQKGRAKRSSNFNRKEDIQLCISWQSISSDPIIGNEQPGKAYWQRIAEHYHANRDFESDRNANSLEHRWGNIQKEVSKFQGCYEQIERRHPSGIPHQELRPMLRHIPCQCKMKTFILQQMVQKGRAKRSSNFNRKEDIQLCISWQSISSDPIIGNEQPGKAYWQRIAEHYHANRDFESDRNANSLEHRWGNIQKEVSKFQGCYEQIERRHPSGIPHQELLRNSPKFQTLESHKRPRSRKSSTLIESAGEEDEEGDDARKSTTPDLLQPSAKKRPMGRKQAKEKMKNGEDGPYKEAMKDLLDAKEKEAKVKEERWKETKEIQERQLLFAERKLVWDQE